MIDFITRWLPDGQSTLALAHGITVDVTVCGDYLEIDSHCPEWVSVREIYEHLRWQAIPEWEKDEWFRGVAARAKLAFTPSHSRLEIVAERLEKLAFQAEKRCVETIVDDDPILAPYRFQKVGAIWYVHFLVNGMVRKAHFNNSLPFRQMALVLRQPNRPIPYETLASRDDIETLGLIAADRNQRSSRRYGNLTVLQLQDALKSREERLVLARTCGDLDAVAKAVDDIERFHKDYGKDEKDFLRVIRQTEEAHSLGKSFYNSVRQNRLRLFKKLKDNNMKECADYLRVTVTLDGHGYLYRPPWPSPNWIL